MTTDNFCFYLQNRLIQTSQTLGQLYSDTSPFSIPDLEVWPISDRGKKVLITLTPGPVRFFPSNTRDEFLKNATKKRI
jgi:hypothetical protein